MNAGFTRNDYKIVILHIPWIFCRHRCPPHTHTKTLPALATQQVLFPVATVTVIGLIFSYLIAELWTLECCWIDPSCVGLLLLLERCLQVHQRRYYPKGIAALCRKREISDFLKNREKIVRDKRKKWIYCGANIYIIYIR